MPAVYFTVEFDEKDDFDQLHAQGKLVSMIVEAVVGHNSSPFFLLGDRTTVWQGASHASSCIVGSKIDTSIVSRQCGVSGPRSLTVGLRVFLTPTARLLLPMSLTVHRVSWEQMAVGEIQGIGSDEFAPSNGVYCPLVEQDPRCFTLPHFQPAIVQAIARHYPVVDHDRQRLMPERDSLRAAIAGQNALEAFSPIAESLKGAFPLGLLEETVWCVLSYPDVDCDEDASAPRAFIVPSCLLTRVAAEYVGTIPPAHRPAVESSLHQLSQLLQGLVLSVACGKLGKPLSLVLRRDCDPAEGSLHELLPASKMERRPYEDHRDSPDPDGMSSRWQSNAEVGGPAEIAVLAPAKRRGTKLGLDVPTSGGKELTRVDMEPEIGTKKAPKRPAKKSRVEACGQ